MIQTWAILVDAYRELNAKKLFWLVLVLSGLVVAAFAALGIDDRGLTFLHWQLGFGPSTGAGEGMSRAFFYKSILFSGFGVKFWLAWLASILALVSTAGIIPEFVAGGSVELSLSKPIGRARLFLTKYAAGLLFVTLQVAVFTAASFLVLGLRGGAWEPRLFLAVPLVVCFFSYLYCVCALLGLITRSTIASLLLTLLAWFVFFGLHVAELGTLQGREVMRLRTETAQREIATLERALAAAPTGAPGGEPRAAPLLGKITDAMARPTRERRLVRRREQLADAVKYEARFDLAHRAIYTVMTPIPKTSETVDLLERTLVSEADLDRRFGQLPDRDEEGPIDFSSGDGKDDLRINQREATRRFVDQVRARSLGWVLGTSLAFEAAVLGLCVLIFSRRDF